MIEDRPVQAALAALIVIQAIMLGSLFADVAPHPPTQTPLFGIGPFIGASIAAAVAAMIMGPRSGRAGKTLTWLVIAAAMISFGPQKYFDAQFPLIWPGVICGQIASIAAGFALINSANMRSDARH